MIFETRYKAWEYLSIALKNKFQDFHNNILVGILKWWLPLTYQIAKELRIPTSFYVVKKLIYQHEYKLWVVTQDGTTIYNKKIIQKIWINNDEIKNIEKKSFDDAKYEKEKYWLFYNDYAWKTVIVIDDWVYSWFSAVAVAKDLKQKWASKLILAIPIANTTVLQQLQTLRHLHEHENKSARSNQH